MARYFQKIAYNQPLRVGEPAPWFTAPAPVNPKFEFGYTAGRWVLLSFFGDAENPKSLTFLEQLAGANFNYDDNTFVSFGVSTQARDQVDGPACRAFLHKRIFLDANMEVARRYGLIIPGESAETSLAYDRWFLLDPELRVYATGPLNAFDQLRQTIYSLPSCETHSGLDESFAPVLVLPRVVSRAYCKALIEMYEKGQPEISGFMNEVNGKTVRNFDGSFKRRTDVTIKDKILVDELRSAILTKIAPAIHKAYQFEVSQVERYIVARYDAEEGGFFRAHRDNTTLGTAHRRFAVTINLNTEDYDGGDLRFPEYGMRTYKAPTGGAVVFSCALLHEARPVTRGTRYATLPFLYDDAGAEVRKQNAASLEMRTRPDIIE
ncbi:MAG: putative 2-oxoglutarate/Fe(II)-dependent dioxygenase YbiX/peroxiredoxin [Planctomycetota bacterium]|jgi:predicted 2-oxoglutarate/Fe(II)-dependent dioxygenase YbiX/peroxiredoxin